MKPVRGHPAAAGQRELHQVPPAQGPHGHPRQDPHAARQAHQPEQPGVHRLPRPHRPRGARREQRGQHGSLHHVPRADHRSQPAATSATTRRPSRASRIPPTSSPSTAAWPSPTSGTACAATTTRRSSATAATQKPTPGHYSGNWPYAHGKEAKKDRGRCLGCHTEEQLCNQCHTVDHPADWATSHAPVAAKGDAVVPRLSPDADVRRLPRRGGRERGGEHAVSARRAVLVGAGRGLPAAGRRGARPPPSRSPSPRARPTAASSATPSPTSAPSRSTAWRRA